MKMAKDITIGELEEWRKQVLEAYKEGSNQVETAFFKHKKISWQQKRDAEGELQKLKLLAAQLLGLIASRRLDDLLSTDVDSPASRIGIATDKLKVAAQRVDKFLEFLQVVADVIQIASGLVVAIQTGAIAQIKTALD
ncbi:MAG: hypothetical protein KME11_07445 [Timaviella obliquedivisa GSE-PSE-MK23-08B]|jgi:hypothetical protein|nr:hypothetical protein [Timaviella obliquedivisa GSE-PSE-MK23-08B]